MGYSMLTFWVGFVFLTLFIQWGVESLISCDDCYIWYWRAFQFFMACALFVVVVPCKYLQDSEDSRRGGRGARGCSPLMVLVACWFMGLFELWLGVLLYVINNWERGPCTATNWQKVQLELEVLQGIRDWQGQRGGGTTPEGSQLRGWCQSRSLACRKKLVLICFCGRTNKIQQQQKVPQFVKQGTSQGEERTRRRRRSKGMENKKYKAADATSLRFSQLAPTDLWQGID